MMPPVRSLACLCLVLALVLARALSPVDGGYTACSNPAVCSGTAGSCCTSAEDNGVATDYCCQGTCNSLDFIMKQCSASPDCCK
jgi:hypothetical protein